MSILSRLAPKALLPSYRRTQAVCVQHLAALALASLLPNTSFAACPTPGEWWQSGQPVANSDLLATAARQQVVLLGEQHDEKAHHRWQLHTLAGLHALRDDLVIGLEMLPRSAQPALDAWIAGDLDDEAMLEQTQWDEAWGFDSALYMPILAFARMAQIPFNTALKHRNTLCSLTSKFYITRSTGVPRYQVSIFSLVHIH